jgi:hypothetical protein
MSLQLNIEIAALRRQLASAKEGNSLKVNMEAAHKRIAALEQGLNEALNQRDALALQVRQLQKSQTQLPDTTDLAKKLYRAQSALSDLERKNQKMQEAYIAERDRAYRGLQDHRVQRDALRKDASKVESEVKRLEELLRQKDLEIKQMHDRNPFRDEHMMRAYMLSKENELSVYRAANANYQLLATKIVQDPHAASNFGQLRREAERMLFQSLQANDQLPEDWERRVTEGGITYYIDHKRKLSTWIHPKYGGDAIDTTDSFFTPMDTMSQPLLPSSSLTASGSSRDRQMQLLANIRAAQIKAAA